MDESAGQATSQRGLRVPGTGALPKTRENTPKHGKTRENTGESERTGFEVLGRVEFFERRKGSENANIC
jgi:hypothetical protein